MKKNGIYHNLPAAVAILGVLGCLLRGALYKFCLDGKGLLPANHPLELALWALTLAALALIFLSVWKLDGSNRYPDNFSPSFPAAAGHILAAAGILLTVLLKRPRMSGVLGGLWQAVGLICVPCLAAAGFARLRGKRPFFLLHMAPCLFLVFHIVNHYRLWSGNPQLQDYIFTLFGTMALMFFGFYNAAFDVGSGRRRMQLGMGLAAVYLCLVNLPDCGYPFLYLGCIAWAITGLCTLDPKPRQPSEEGEPEA